MDHTAFSHLCWVDNIWLFAPNTSTLQTIIDALTHRLHHDLGMHWKPKSLQIMRAAHVPRKDRNVVTARGLEGYRLVFDPGRSSGALLASLQAGNSAFCEHEGLLRDKKVAPGRAKAFGSACTASTLHGSETLHLDNAGLRELKGWEGRCLRSMRHFRRATGNHTSTS